MSDPRTGEFLLRTAQNMIVENDDVADAIMLRRAPSRGEVMAEICRQLEPFQADDGQAISGATVISKDLSIDSLAVMDMVMDLEDRFDVSIPMNVVAEIHTVDELADTILALSARR
jgi:acyl carrier protein